MSQNINSVLGGMPDDIEKGGKNINIFMYKPIFNKMLRIKRNENKFAHETSKDY